MIKNCNGCGQLHNVSGGAKYCSLSCRFGVKVDRSGDCHVWIGSITRGGYGRIAMARGGVYAHAHRVAWEMTNGPISDGLSVLHKCDNRPCVNPDHLFLGTQADNMADMVSKLRNRRGEAAPHAKLTDEDVRRIRNHLVEFPGLSQEQIGQMFGMAQSSIGRVIRREAWEHMPRNDAHRCASPRRQSKAGQERGNLQFLYGHWYLQLRAGNPRGTRLRIMLPDCSSREEARECADVALCYDRSAVMQAANDRRGARLRVTEGVPTYEYSLSKTRTWRRAA
jgi:hypothetical protein